VWHEFAGDTSGTFSFTGNTKAFTTDRVGTFGQIGLGVTAQSLNTGLLGFVRADYRIGEKTTGYSINAGVRYQF
jgi:outer membrane autotransporter protein